MEQRWKLPHLFHNGASSYSMDVGEQQQLCCREVHLLLFQKSLGRELLTEAGIHRPGWCCPCRLGGFLIASSNSSLWPSERQCCLWAMCQTLCATWPCVCSSQVTEDTLTNTGWPKEGRAAVWCHTQGCHCTLAEDSAKWDLHTVLQSSELGCLPHPAQGFTTITGQFPVGFFKFEAWPLKKIQWIWNMIKELRLDSEVWVNDLKNQCLYWVSQVWFLLLMALSAIVSGVTANWGGIKLFL